MAIKCPIQQKKIWIISDGRMGMRAQCLGLVQALARLSPLTQPVYDLKITLPTRWSWLPPLGQEIYLKLSGGMNLSRFLGFCQLLSDHTDFPNDLPDVIICCGRRTIAPVLALADHAQKQGHPLKTIYLQDPRYGYHKFDLILAPEHDVAIKAVLQNQKHILPTKGAIHRIDAPALAQAKQDFADQFSPNHTNPNHSGPNLAVLLGGPNKGYHFPPELAKEWGQMLGDYARHHNGRLLVTASRRTPDDSQHAFQQACCAISPNTYIWDTQSPNPYLGLLAWADAIILTNDSVNMISEACATDKPVFMLSLKGDYPKFDLFHQQLIDQNRLIPIRNKIPAPDNWPTVTPLHEPERIAHQVQELLSS